MRIVNSAVPVPVGLERVVTQVSGEDTRHEQNPSVVMVTVRSPPPAFTVIAPGETLNGHVAAACEMVTRCSEIVTSSARGLVDGFG